jgi:hypothetical protein
VAGLVVVGSLGASCGGQGSESAPVSASPKATSNTVPSTSATGPLTAEDDAANAPFAQVCAALNAALAGELDVVRSTFDHGALHVLADAATDVDRAVAARLLEAKEALESDLAEPSTPAAAVVADLEALTTATAAAVGVTAVGVAPTCDQENP